MRTANSFGDLTGTFDYKVNYGFVMSPIAGDGGRPVRLLTFDTAWLKNRASTLSASSSAGYSYYGGLHEYRYTESITYTPDNFGYDEDTNLYFHLPAVAEQTLTVNNEKFTVTMDDDDGAFVAKDASGRTVSGDPTVTQVVPTTPIAVAGAVAGGKASGEVTERELLDKLAEALKALEAYKESGAAGSAASGSSGAAPIVGEIKLDLRTSDPGKVESSEITLPVAALKEIATHKDIILTVQTDMGQVTFDAASLAGMATAAGSAAKLTVTIAAVPVDQLNTVQLAVAGEYPMFRLTVMAGGFTVPNFGGTVTVVLPYKPAAGEDAAKLGAFHIDAKGVVTPMPGAKYDAALGGVTFATSHFSLFFVADADVIFDGRIPLAFLANPFRDVSPTDWYYDAVVFANANGLMLGTAEGIFSPNAKLSRATIATILWRMEGAPAASGGAAFSDVPAGQWYTGAVQWASANGIVAGYGDGRFGPNDDTTREQLAAIMHNYAKLKNIATAETTFTTTAYGTSATSSYATAYADASDVSDWAQGAMQWANGTGLIKGRTPTTLSPQGTATRAEAAAILQRFITQFMEV
jgi:hypothetical protein